MSPSPDRVNGPAGGDPALLPGLPTTGMLYGEALGTNWLSSQKKIEEGHQVTSWTKAGTSFASSPKAREFKTWVNGHLIEDYTNEDLYKTHARGFIGLQAHGLSERELALPINAGPGRHDQPAADGQVPGYPDQAAVDRLEPESWPPMNTDERRSEIKHLSAFICAPGLFLSP